MQTRAILRTFGVRYLQLEKCVRVGKKQIISSRSNGHGQYILSDKMVKCLFHKTCFELRSLAKVFQFAIFFVKLLVVRLALEVYRPLISKSLGH